MLQNLISFLIAICAATAAGAQIVQFSGAPTGSSLGMNLATIAYYSSEQPFLNIVKNTSQWAATGANTTDIVLDANGYPTAIPGGASDVYTNIYLGMNSPYYPSGQYIALYDCTGCTVVYSNDASKTSGTPGRDVLTVTPSGAGIHVSITATGTAPNNFRNFRLVEAQYESLLAGGEVFHPTFLARVSGFKGFRFMDWMRTNELGIALAWSARPTTTQAFYGVSGTQIVYSGSVTIPAGAPIETQVALCNRASSTRCWFNLPVGVDDTYVTNFATYIRDNLIASCSIYIEYGNEIWNAASPTQRNYIAGLANTYWVGGIAAWNSGTTYASSALVSYAGSIYVSLQGSNTNHQPDISPTFWSFATNTLALSWQAKRTSEIADIFASVWGGSFSRVTPVMGSQAANTAITNYLMQYSAVGSTGNLYCSNPATVLPVSCTTAVSANIKAIAIAPYFGYCGNPAWSLTDLFQEINSGGASPTSSCSVAGGMLGQTLGWITSQRARADAYSRELVAYEGGQSLVSSSDATLGNLYISAQHDDRMGPSTLTLLNGWKSNNAGTHDFFYYNDIIADSVTFGSWGALTNALVTSSPKYNAIVGYR